MADDFVSEEFALTHVLLPRKLPENKPSYSQQLGLMKEMVSSVYRIGNCLPQKTIEMLKNFRDIQEECTEAGIARGINKLCPGDTFTMFVRRQNCAIMIYMPPNQNENVIVATFPGNLPMSDIYRNESDIEVGIFYVA